MNLFLWIGLISLEIVMALQSKHPIEFETSNDAIY